MTGSMRLTIQSNAIKETSPAVFKMKGRQEDFVNLFDCIALS